MKLKKIISVFILLVMSIQVLPMQQIAAWLSSGQINEEITQSINPIKGKPGNEDAHPPYTFFNHQSEFLNNISSSDRSLHHDERVYLRDADEILSPPPNC